MPETDTQRKEWTSADGLVCPVAERQFRRETAIADGNIFLDVNYHLVRTKTSALVRSVAIRFVLRFAAGTVIFRAGLFPDDCRSVLFHNSILPDSCYIKPVEMTNST